MILGASENLAIVVLATATEIVLLCLAVLLARGGSP